MQSPLDVLSHQLGLSIMLSGYASPRPSRCPPRSRHGHFNCSALVPRCCRSRLWTHARPRLDSNSRPKSVPALVHDPAVETSPAPVETSPGPHCRASSFWLLPRPSEYLSPQPHSPSHALVWSWSRINLSANTIPSQGSGSGGFRWTPAPPLLQAPPHHLETPPISASAGTRSGARSHPQAQALEEVHVWLRTLWLLTHQEQQRAAPARWHHRVAAHDGSQWVRLELFL